MAHKVYLGLEAAHFANDLFDGGSRPRSDDGADRVLSIKASVAKQPRWMEKDGMTYALFPINRGKASKGDPALTWMDVGTATRLAAELPGEPRCHQLWRKPGALKLALAIAVPGSLGPAASASQPQFDAALGAYRRLLAAALGSGRLPAVLTAEEAAALMRGVRDGADLVSAVP